jgi:hypothetical protein
MLSACESRKKVVDKPEQGYNKVDSVFQTLKDNEFKYDWLKASFKVSAETSDGSFNFSGQLRMRKDSIIWISISPALGIEVVRLMVTPDSVFLINKLKRTYIKEDVSHINDFLGTELDFDMVQSLLIGNDFTYYSKDQFQIRETDQEYIFNTVSRRKLKEHLDSTNVDNLLIQKMFLSKTNYKITQQDIKQVRNPNKKLTVLYSDFMELNNQLIPSTEKFQIKGVEDIKIDLDFSKFTVNESMRFPFKISSKYERL